MRRRLTDERGLAAPLVVSLAGLLVVLSELGGVGGRLLVESRRADAAADLAALAAASAAQLGRPPCPAAADTAARNGARLLDCSTAGPVVTLTVGRQVALPLSGAVTVRADARAGPVAP